MFDPGAPEIDFLHTDTTLLSCSAPLSDYLKRVMVHRFLSEAHRHFPNAPVFTFCHDQANQLALLKDLHFQEKGTTKGAAHALLSPRYQEVHRIPDVTLLVISSALLAQHYSTPWIMFRAPMPQSVQPNIYPSHLNSFSAQAVCPLTFRQLANLDGTEQTAAVRFVEKMLAAHPVYSAAPEWSRKHEAKMMIANRQKLGLVAIWRGEVIGFGLARRHADATSAAQRSNFLANVEGAIHAEVESRETLLATTHGLGAGVGMQSWTLRSIPHFRQKLTSSTWRPLA
jgi:hypothetical protein